MIIALLSDTDVSVHTDGDSTHVMLRIGVVEYDISEIVFADQAVEDAINTLEAMKNTTK